MLSLLISKINFWVKLLIASSEIDFFVLRILFISFALSPRLINSFPPILTQNCSAAARACWRVSGAEMTALKSFVASRSCCSSIGFGSPKPAGQFKTFESRNRRSKPAHLEKKVRRCPNNQQREVYRKIPGDLYCAW